MDGAVGRVSLRGMGLLHGSRTRRERDAKAEVARRLDDARQAALAAQRAQDAMEQQRRAWREREAETLLAMQGVEVQAGELSAHWVMMDRFADAAVRLQAERSAAEDQKARAEQGVVQARGMLKLIAQKVQKTEAVIGRIQRWRDRAAETAEQIESEDDAIRRHAARSAR